MPSTLPPGFGDVNKSGEGSGGRQMIRGIFPATAFKIEQKSHKRKGEDVYYYSIDWRIDGGDYDGEDVNAYVALYADAIYNLHDILVALGVLDTYYHRFENPDPKGPTGEWVGVPSVDDLQGKRLLIQVDNAPWQSTDRTTKVGLVNPDGTPVLREGNGITRYFSANEPVPEYRPREIKPNLAKTQPTNAGGQGAGGFTSGNAFPGQVNDVWGGDQGGQPASQPGTSPW